MSNEHWRSSPYSAADPSTWAGEPPRTIGEAVDRLERQLVERGSPPIGKVTSAEHALDVLARRIGARGRT